MKKVIGFAKEFGVSILSLALPLLASAQTLPTLTTPIPYAKISSAQGLLQDVCVVFGYAFYLLVTLAVLFIVIAAYRFLTSSGESEKVKTARNTLLYAAIALGVALLAKAIPNIVSSFLGATGKIGAC